MTESGMNDRERELTQRLQSLPREIEPPAEAWQAIRARLVEEPRAQAPAVTGPRWWQRPALLAAAALLLAAGSSLGTLAVVRGDTVAPPGPVAVGGPNGTAAFAEFVVRENDYLQHVNSLIALIEDESSGLSPETIATIRANLLVIDAAILDARRALAEDPANRRLVEILASTYEKKLDLLRRTTAMARS